MAAGIVIIIFSFFLRDSSNKLEKDVEELSISIFQETNALKRRIKIVEEELMLEPEFQVTPNTHRKVQKQPKESQQLPVQAQQSFKPIHDIIISQVIQLNKQGLSIPDISIRSNLTEAQVLQVLATGGR